MVFQSSNRNVNYGSNQLGHSFLRKTISPELTIAFFFFFNGISLYNSGCLGIHYIEQSGPQFTQRSSASRGLGLNACASQNFMLSVVLCLRLRPHAISPFRSQAGPMTTQWWENWNQARPLALHSIKHLFCVQYSWTFHKSIGLSFPSMFSPQQSQVPRSLLQERQFPSETSRRREQDSWLGVESWLSMPGTLVLNTDDLKGKGVKGPCDSWYWEPKFPEEKLCIC